MSKEVSPVNTPNSGKHDVTVSASLSAGLDLPVGRIINERYKIIEELGRGGMGVVYRVQQIALGREMALKTLDGTDIADETWLRFQQEAKATSMLDHPNLISVHDYGIIDGKHPFFVMDLVEGSTLSQIIKKEGPLTVEKAIPIFIQVCFGLAYAHELGIVHRDLKPSNIMVLKTDAANSGVGVKIVDFRIAKLKTPEGTEAQGLTKTGEVFGSPLYMSPEQCLGNRIDHRSDIYAIGCVLFEALTGLPPFMGSTALSTMMMHQAEKPPSLKEATLGKEFPAELQEIVYRLLEKEPNARYQSLGALAHDLSLLQQGSATVALNLPSSIENQKKQKKETILLGSVVGLIACIIVGTAVYYIKEQVDNELYKKSLDSEIARLKASVIDDPKKFEMAIPDITVQSSIIYNQQGKKERRINFLTEVGEFNVVGKGGRRKALGKVELSSEDSIHFESNNNPTALKRDFFLQFQNDDITELAVVQSLLSDEHLKDITNFQGLRDLDISSTDVSDESIEIINRLPKLEKLNVGFNRITEKGILKINRLLELKELRTGELPSANELIKGLKDAKRLEYLRFTSTKLSPEDIANISAIGTITELNLESCEGVTDDTLKILEKMPNLATLALRRTSVTEQGLLGLNKFKHLTKVSVETEKLPRPLIDKLKTACPKIEFIPVR